MNLFGKLIVVALVGFLCLVLLGMLIGLVAIVLIFAEPGANLFQTVGTGFIVLPSILVALVIGILGLSVLKALKGEGARTGTTGEAEETRLIQDTYHGLLKMEERVEALETLLLDRQRKGPNP